MNYYNRLISGDHKGYAALQMERIRGSRYDNDNDFVAAFAQADPGDVTPNTNLNNTGPGEHGCRNHANYGRPPDANGPPAIWQCSGSPHRPH